MIIQPHHDFRQVGMGYNPPTLDRTKTYIAIPATNQPDWKEKGKVFVSFADDGEDPSILLEADDYTTIQTKP